MLSPSTFRACWPRWTRSSRPRSNRWNARTSSTSTSAARTPAPTGTTGASRGGSGRTCSARCAGAPTRPAGCATGCRRSSAVATARNIDMAVIREHLAHKGLGLHNDLQDESSIVGNFPQVIMMDRFGTETQKKEWTEALITGERSMAFGLTEPNHGSDATWLETTRRCRRRRLGHQRRQAVQHRRAPGHPRPGLRPHLGRSRARPAASPRSWCRPTRPDSPCRTTGGRSTCPPTTARSSSRMSGCPATPCSARWTAASRSARPSCTRTGFGRPPAAWAPRSTASTAPSGMRASA